MYKKVKDDRLQRIKDQNIHSALSKIDGPVDNLVDEEVLIEELIKKKKE